MTLLGWDDNEVDLLARSSKRMERLALACGGRDLRWISAYVITKLPHAPGLEWHQDWWAWQHAISRAERPPQVGLLCYLTGASAHEGALRVLPGSHTRRSSLHDRLLPAHDPNNDMSPGTASERIPGERTLAARPGDAILLDYRTLHCTHPNTRNASRVCLQTSWIPSWKETPADIRAHLVQHPCLPQGDMEASHNRSSAIRLFLPTYEGVRASIEINRQPSLSE
jgi:ectoine hydroxylase-related dioxygenase (phytanoyl-CoA dioxygenase family)